MIQIEYLALILTGIGIIVSILYYANVLRNADRTRQTQLFMQFYNAWLDTDFYTEMIEIAFLWEFEDYEDFMNKYWMTSNLEAFAKWGRAQNYLEGMGVLMKRGLLDPSLMDDLQSGYIITMWEKYEPIIYEIRVRMNQPQFGEFFEYLYREIRKTTLDDHPELKDKAMKWE